MKHKWEVRPETNQIGIGRFKEWVCKVCGCEKSLAYYKFATPSYQRNGQNYGDTYIDCVDEQAEKLKTID